MSFDHSLRKIFKKSHLLPLKGTMRRCEAAFLHVEPAFQRGSGEGERGREDGRGKRKGGVERGSGEEGVERGCVERVCACAVRVVMPHTTTTGLNSAIICFTSKKNAESLHEIAQCLEL